MLANFKIKSIEDLKNLRADVGNMKKENVINQIREDRVERLERLKETIAEHNPEALLADGFDNAILGYSTELRVVYSVDQIMETLVERDGMTPDEAIEYFEYNISCAYVGEYTPIYMYEE